MLTWCKFHLTIVKREDKYCNIFLNSTRTFIFRLMLRVYLNILCCLYDDVFLTLKNYLPSCTVEICHVVPEIPIPQKCFNGIIPVYFFLCIVFEVHFSYHNHNHILHCCCLRAQRQISSNKATNMCSQMTKEVLNIPPEELHLFERRKKVKNISRTACLIQRAYSVVGVFAACQSALWLSIIGKNDRKKVGINQRLNHSSHWKMNYNLMKTRHWKRLK